MQHPVFGVATAGDMYGRGPTTVELTNPTMDQDRNGEADDVQRGDTPFPRAVVAILGIVGALVAIKFIFEKLA